MAEEEKEKEDPIFEKLAPKECLILSRDSKGYNVACNVDGKITIKRVPLKESKVTKRK